ncbi:hypothetical protein RQP46_003699 [Phenoliferia psychrophenolica]
MLKIDDPLQTLDLTHLKPLKPWREVDAPNIAYIFEQPEEWPGEVPFLTIPRPSPLLPRLDRIRFCSPPLATPPNAPPPVEIKRVNGRNHPCKGQFGLYNGERELDKGTWIRDYLGEIHTDPESKKSSDYDVCVLRSQNPLETISIDATEAGNEARYINDYRGIVTRPNAVFEVREWPLPGGLGVGMRMAIWVEREIRPHEEIVVSYGRAYWDQRKAEKKDAEKAARKAKRHAAPVKPKFNLDHRIKLD